MFSEGGGGGGVVEGVEEEEDLGSFSKSWTACAMDGARGRILAKRHTTACQSPFPYFGTTITPTRRSANSAFAPETRSRRYARRLYGRRRENRVAADCCKQVAQPGRIRGRRAGNRVEVLEGQASRHLDEYATELVAEVMDGRWMRHLRERVSHRGDQGLQYWARVDPPFW